MFNSRRISSLAAVFSLSASLALAQAPTGTAFTYQGQLKQGGAVVNGTANLSFTLFDAATAGTMLGTPQSINGVTVTEGLFTVSLNGAGQFGPNAFNGEG